MLSTAMYLLLNILFLALVTAHHPESSEQCPHDAEEEWTYREEYDNGPENWGDQCKNGKNQSPINIVRSDIEPVKDEDRSEIQFQNYDEPITNARIKNNGHSVELEPLDDKIRTISIGEKTYTFRQLHFHWGCDKWSKKGSEHTIDGQSYPLEMHLVHTTGNGNETYADAAVLTVFFKWFFWFPFPHFELQKIVDQLNQTHHKDDDGVRLNSNLTLIHLLPWNTRSYYTYEGSLTTPPCTEGVRFFIFKKPTWVAECQLEEFRCLHSTPEGETDALGCKLCGNNRPTQPLNGRKVYDSHIPKTEN